MWWRRQQRPRSCSRRSASQCHPPSLICTGARQNPATCSTNQGNCKRLFDPTLRAVGVRTGSWAGPPRGERAPRVGISSTVFGVPCGGGDSNTRDHARDEMQASAIHHQPVVDALVLHLPRVWDSGLGPSRVGQLPVTCQPTPRVAASTSLAPLSLACRPAPPSRVSQHFLFNLCIDLR